MGENSRGQLSISYTDPEPSNSQPPNFQRSTIGSLNNSWASCSAFE